MMKLVNSINKLKKSNVKDTIDARMKEFTELGKRTNEDLFKELCFCILTANYTATGGIKIQKEVDSGFLELSEKSLSKRLKTLGHRFPNTRTNYIITSRRCKDSLKKVITELKGETLREWLVTNVKGFGYKEASHFLRNIGFTDYAIIDFHIVDILVKNKIIKEPKTLNKKTYIEIEEKMRMLAKKVNLNLAELDMYLWYLETGKILK